MTDAARALRIFSALREQGFRLSIDDFGTGYSSLQYLRRLPVHALKVDRSFIKDVADDRKSLAVCAAVLALGRSLGLEVIAEGVETTGQVEALRAHGCSRVQGFLIGRPMPAASVAAWIKRGDWRRLAYGTR
jgi:EAL domain-containing protein (putative c-di-GMP-specific phosphodiesterase class I)